MFCLLKYKFKLTVFFCNKNSNVWESLHLTYGVKKSQRVALTVCIFKKSRIIQKSLCSIFLAKVVLISLLLFFKFCFSSYASLNFFTVSLFLGFWILVFFFFCCKVGGCPKVISALRVSSSIVLPRLLYVT